MGPFQPSLRGDTTSFYILKTIALTAPPQEVTCPRPYQQPRPSQSPFIHNRNFYSSPECVSGEHRMRA